MLTVDLNLLTTDGSVIKIKALIGVSLHYRVEYYLLNLE